MRGKHGAQLRCHPPRQLKFAANGETAAPLAAKKRGVRPLFVTSPACGKICPGGPLTLCTGQAGGRAAARGKAEEYVGTIAKTCGGQSGAVGAGTSGGHGAAWVCAGRGAGVRRAFALWAGAGDGAGPHTGACGRAGGLGGQLGAADPGGCPALHRGAGGGAGRAAAGAPKALGRNGGRGRLPADGAADPDFVRPWQPAGGLHCVGGGSPQRRAGGAAASAGERGGAAGDWHDAGGQPAAVCPWPSAAGVGAGGHGGAGAGLSGPCAGSGSGRGGAGWCGGSGLSGVQRRCAGGLHWRFGGGLPGPGRAGGRRCAVSAGSSAGHGYRPHASGGGRLCGHGGCERSGVFLPAAGLDAGPAGGKAPRAEQPRSAGRGERAAERGGRRTGGCGGYRGGGKPPPAQKRRNL